MRYNKTVKVNKIFVVPHVAFSLPEQLRFNILTNRNVQLYLYFRKWELEEYSASPISSMVSENFIECRNPQTCYCSFS